MASNSGPAGGYLQSTLSAVFGARANMRAGASRPAVNWYWAPTKCATCQAELAQTRRAKTIDLPMRECEKRCFFFVSSSFSVGVSVPDGIERRGGGSAACEPDD